MASGGLVACIFGEWRCIVHHVAATGVGTEVVLQLGWGYWVSAVGVAVVGSILAVSAVDTASPHACARWLSDPAATTPPG